MKSNVVSIDLRKVRHARRKIVRHFEPRACQHCGQTYIPTSGCQKFCPNCHNITAIKKQEAKRAISAQRIDQRTQEMLALRNQGLTNTEIAGKFNVDYVTVRHYIGKQPDSHRGKGYASREKMLQLRAMNYTNAEIARKIGLSVPTINKHIGAQPAYITKASARIATEKRMLNARRRLEIAPQIKAQLSTTLSPEELKAPVKSKTAQKLESARAIVLELAKVLA